jgi:hypothetical protein
LLFTFVLLFGELALLLSRMSPDLLLIAALPCSTRNTEAALFSCLLL